MTGNPRPGPRRDLEKSATLILFAMSAMLLVGCALSEGRAEDTMMIVNTLGDPITVTYEVVVNGQTVPNGDVVDLSAGQRSYVSPQLFGSEPCLPGEFVARTGEEVVDRHPQPCKEQVWEVTGP